MGTFQDQGKICKCNVTEGTGLDSEEELAPFPIIRGMSNQRVVLRPSLEVDPPQLPQSSPHPIRATKATERVFNENGHP